MTLNLIGWSAAVNALVGGGIVLALQALGRALVTDVATRITASVWGIRAFDATLGRLRRHPVWSGTWEVAWHVESASFAAVNAKTGRLFRCLHAVAFEGHGTTASGHSVPYAFVGRLSRDKTILTGTWFDRRAGDVGYHGVFQLKLWDPNGGRASGRWAGFSETRPIVNADLLEWERVGD